MKHRRTAHAHQPKPAMFLLLFTLLLSTLLLAQIAAPTSAQGVAPDLDDAETFGLLAANLTTPMDPDTGTSGTTVHFGDAGAGANTGSPATPDGTFYEAGEDEYLDANTALGAAILDANAQDATATLDADLGGQTLLPGVYDSVGNVEIGSDPLTLSGNGVFIFQIAGTFNMAADTTVVLADGAQDCNVFWVPAEATTLAANTHFRGNLLMGSAATTVGITTRIDGRILSQNAVTFSEPGPSEIFVPQSCDPVDTQILSIDKESAEDSVNVGDTVNYSVTVTNKGNVTLTDVTLFDLFDPDHFTFVEVTGVAAVGTSVPGELSWDHGTLEPGRLVTYNLVFTADTATAEGGSANTAVAFSDEHGLRVQSTTSVVISAPILSIDKESAQDSVSVGDTVNYSVTVTNTGSVTLTDVTISDTFDPDHFTLVEVTGVATVDTSLPGEVSWDHGLLEPDQAVTYNLVFTADTATAEGGSVNTATAFSAEHGLQVQDTALVVIIAPALSINKESAQDSVTVGDTVNYSITVTNTGSVTLTDVTISDTFDPDHFTLVEVAGVATVNISLPGQVSWDHGLLEPDQAVTYNLSFTADTATAEGGSVNTATAFSAEHDLQVEDTASVVISGPIITEPEEEEPTPLPVTGGNTLMMLLLGTLLAAAGFGLWLLSRTRNV